MSRVLKGTIYVPNDDGSLTAVLGGTAEADAKKQVPAAVFRSWGDHVWKDDEKSVPPVLTVAPPEPDPEPDPDGGK